MRVSKDAKYSVTTGNEIKLEFQESKRVRVLLTTTAHERLAEMVNKVKVDELGQPGGAFYINEYRDVLVPDGRGGPCFWAGNYEDDELEFEEGSLFVTPRAPDHLEPGEPWPGPHVGIPYVLSAGALEIGYENVDGAVVKPCSYPTSSHLPHRAPSLPGWASSRDSPVVGSSSTSAPRSSPRWASPGTGRTSTSGDWRTTPGSRRPGASSGYNSGLGQSGTQLPSRILHRFLAGSVARVRTERAW